jgi:hypothetical protein
MLLAHRLPHRISRDGRIDRCREPPETRLFRRQGGVTDREQSCEGKIDEFFRTESCCDGGIAHHPCTINPTRQPRFECRHVGHDRAVGARRRAARLP